MILKALKEDENTRLDIFLQSQIKNLSRTRIKKIILEKCVKLNTKIISEPSKKIKYNDNGFLLKNDLAMDDSYSESSEALVGQLQMDYESESRVF